MGLGVNKKNCRFYVDEAARVVVCVIPNTRFTFVNFLEGNLYQNGIVLPFPPNYDNYKFPSSISAKAKCAPEDEWNEEYGRELAYQRAKEKYYRYFFNFADKYFAYIEKQVSRCAELFDGVQARLNKKADAQNESEDNDQ